MKRGQERVIEGYVEKHHIVPKSLGGSNLSSNISRLTPREHFVAHILLIKLTTGRDLRKMCYALHKMMYGMPKLRPLVYSKSLHTASRLYKGGLNSSPCSDRKRAASRANGIAIWQDPSKRAQMINSMKATAATPERRKAFVEAALKASTPEVNAKKSESAKQRRWSEETKRKMSESRKALYADPERRAQALERSAKTKQS